MRFILGLILLAIGVGAIAVARPIGPALAIGVPALVLGLVAMSGRAKRSAK
jgi:hypothetical protein